MSHVSDEKILIHGRTADAVQGKGRSPDDGVWNVVLLEERGDVVEERHMVSWFATDGMRPADRREAKI